MVKRSRRSRCSEGEGWALITPEGTDSAADRDSSPPPGPLRIRVERRKKGKTVTVIDGLGLGATETRELGRALRSACATGGTVAGGCIELQGDCSDRARAWLAENGWPRGR